MIGHVLEFTVPLLAEIAMCRSERLGDLVLDALFAAGSHQRADPFRYLSARPSDRPGGPDYDHDHAD